MTLTVMGAVTLKAALLALDAVPFNADEAIVALMARHILQGEHPWFFYGQAYMGSLDAYLIAGTFLLMGQSVLAVRVVQIALFVGTLLTSHLVAQRISDDRRVALLTTLLMGFPPVLLTLYTTATLGGYGEALLMGNLLLWLGHRLAHEDAQRWPSWLAWGFVAGLGFWAFGLILVYVIPIGLWLLRQAAEVLKQKLDSYSAARASNSTSYVSRFTFHVSRFTIIALGFALGSLPWWLGNLGQIGTGVAELSGEAVRSTATASSLLINVSQRLFNFVVFGLPALFGLRFPWSVKGPPLWLAVLPLALYLGALLRSLHRLSSSRNGRLLLWGIWATLFLGFVLTPFGGDPSGRYFLPLYLPLSIFTAEALIALYKRIGRWAWALLALVLAFNLVGTAQAAFNNPPSITTQFDAISQIDHRYYDDLIAFLRAHDATRGYANYWIAYPIAFLSGEEIILVPRLPYKADRRYTSRDDRYAPYGEIVEASSQAVYITSNHPELDTLLQEQFTALGVDFHERQIGDFHVFYDLSRKVTPEELDIYREAKP